MRWNIFSPLFLLRGQRHAFSAQYLAARTLTKRTIPKASATLSTGPTPSPTEIDRYFARFPSFPYDPALPAASQFAHLSRTQESWRDKNKPTDEGKAERQRFNAAFSEEFAEKFGYLEEDGLEDKQQKWMHLAQVLEIEPIPETVACFKKVRECRDGAGTCTNSSTCSGRGIPG